VRGPAADQLVQDPRRHQCDHARVPGREREGPAHRQRREHGL